MTTRSRELVDACNQSPSNAMTTKSDDPDSPLGELAHLHAALASIESAMRDLHPQLAVPANPDHWGDSLRQWNATQLAKVVEPDESIREWMQRWRASEDRLKTFLKNHNATLPEGLWQWRHDPECYTLCRHHGQPAATVYPNGTWHTWNLDGIGGENSTEPTLDQAMQEALAAVVRQDFDITPPECESCGGSGYESEQAEEDPDLTLMRARCAMLEDGLAAYKAVARSRAALVDALSGQLAASTIATAIARAAELGGSPLDCSVVELRYALKEVQNKLTGMHRAVPRYPTLGSMGGGSVRETELQTKWKSEVGSWADTFTRLQGFIESGLRVADRALTTECDRRHQCVRCGNAVEEARRCYAIPHCFECLPPPEPLPIAGNAPACPKCGCANFVIRKRCRDCGEDLVMHPEPEIDAEVRWDAEDARRADGEVAAASISVAVFGRPVNTEANDGDDPTKIGPPTPGLNVEWSPFSMCGTPKNWGSYGGENTGWYCSVGVVDGFDALPDLSATGEGESLADAELDAIRKLLPQIIAYVPDTAARQRAQLHAIEVAARRLRAAVPT